MENFIDFILRNLSKKSFLLINGIFISIMVGIISVIDRNYYLLSFLIIVIGLLVIYKNLFLGLLLFVLLIPSEVVLVNSYGASILRYLGIVIAVIWLIKILYNHKKIRIIKTSFIYLSFFIWGVLSLFWAPYPDVGYQTAITYLQLAILLIILIDQVSTLEKLKKVILALLIGGIISLLLFYFMSDFNLQGRLILLTSRGSGLAVYGYPLAFSMTIFGIVGILGKGKAKIIGIFGYLFGLYPLIGLGLRGALLASIFGIFSAIIVSPTKKRKFAILIALALLFIFSLLFYLNIQPTLPTKLIERLTVSAALDSGGSNRLLIWRILLDLFPKHPIFGLGLNQFGSYIFNHFLYRLDVGSHNDYLETLVSLGVVGFVLLIVGEFVCIINLIKMKSLVVKKEIVWFGILIGLFIASVISQNFVNQLVWKYVWIIRAFVIVGSQPEIWLKKENTVTRNNYIS